MLREMWYSAISWFCSKKALLWCTGNAGIKRVLKVYHDYNAERDVQYFKSSADKCSRKLCLIGEVLEFFNESRGLYVSSLHSAQHGHV